MNGVVLFGLGLALFVCLIAYFWYFFKTLRVMWRFNIFIAIMAFFLNPLVHIIFYFFPKDGFDGYTRGLFKKYFLSLVVFFIFAMIAAVVIPALEAKKTSGALSNGVDGRDPWEWIIRSERLE